jgi:hypothetical protein
MSSNKYVSPNVVKSLGQTPREVLNSAVATGLVSPDFEPSEDMGAFKPYWDQYKAEMKGDDMGAFWRGAKEAIGPTLGAIGGATMGSLADPFGIAAGAGTGIAWGDTVPEKFVGLAIGAGVGLISSPLAGAIAGSALGAEAQQAMFPPTTQDKAQAVFDLARTDTRIAKALGSIVPSLATGRPGSTETQEKILGALIQTGITAGEIISKVYKGEKVDPQQALERYAIDLAAAMYIKPWKYTRYLFDKKYRQEVIAQNRREKIFEGVAGSPEMAEKLAQDIQESIPYIRSNVNLGAGNMSSGEVSQSVALIGMQAALERKVPELMDKRIQAKAGITSNLSKVLGEQTVDPEITQQKFAELNKQSLEQLERTRQTIVRYGDLEGAQIWSEAKAQIQKIGDEAAQGVIDAELAHAQATSVMNDAMSRYQVFNGSLNKESASRAAYVQYAANKKISGKIAGKAYSRLKKESENIMTDLDNAYRTALQLSKPVSRTNSKGRPLSEVKQNIPLEAEIEGILLLGRPFQKGTRRKYTVFTLQKELARVNSAIRDATPGSESLRRLNELKTSLMDDLDDMGKNSELVRQANELYKQHAEIFLNGKSSNASRVAPSEFADHFLNGTVEDMRQFRAAMSDPVTGELPAAMIEEMEVWMLNHVNSKLGMEANPKTLGLWFRQNEKGPIFDAFPELRGKVGEILRDIEATAEIVDEKVFAKNSAVTNQEKAQQFLARYQAEQERLVAQTKEAAIKAGDEYFAAASKELQDTAVTRFIGPEPDVAIQKIFDNDEIKRLPQFRQLVDAAMQDQSGMAMEGLRSAFRKYLQDRFAKYGTITSKKNKIAAEVSFEDLDTSIRELNIELNPNSIYRKAMDMILDPREVEAVRLARKQLEILNRKSSLTQGESSTQYNTTQDTILENALSGNLLDLVSTVARGIDPSKRSATARTGEALARVFKQLWQGDVKMRTQQLMVEAMANPQISIEVLRKVSPETMPQVNAFLRAWTVSKQRDQEYMPVPFGTIDVTEEFLQNGTITTDTKYGYKIIQTKSGNFQLMSPSGQPLGVFQSKQEAEARSGTHFSQNLLKKL